jgi:hydroxyacylglutathione hydrolase
LLKHNDKFHVGKVQFEVLHTPGHTPESISFVLTDQGGGADEPMGIFTGDFVFVGSIGRPDLLEEAAGLAGTAEPGARDLFRSAMRFKELPDYLQIWPAHGAGSACGKGLGAIPSSTVGYEKRFNPALQFEDEQAFVDYILAEQPEAPPYFAVMKSVNKEGPALLGDLGRPNKEPADNLESIAGDHRVIDTRTAQAFSKAHVPGTVNIPLAYLAAWAGWLVDYEQPVYLLTTATDLPEAVRVLRKIGADKLVGFFDSAEVTQSKLNSQSYEQVTASEIHPRVAAGEVVLIDVRGDVEWQERHISEAKRCFLGKLPGMLEAFTGECPLVFQCRSGGRSAIATSLAQAAGVLNAKNMEGGINGWIDAGLPVNRAPEVAGPHSDALANEVACQGQAVYWTASCPA